MTKKEEKLTKEEEEKKAKEDKEVMAFISLSFDTISKSKSQKFDLYRMAPKN